METKKEPDEGIENPFVQRFESFFENVYKKNLERLIGKYPEKRSLEVDFNDIEHFDFELADELLENPDYVLEAAHLAIQNVEVPSLEVDEFKPHIRIFNLPSDKKLQPQLRDIGARQIGKLLGLEGVVVQITDVLPKLKMAAWECKRCGNTYHIVQSAPSQEQPTVCECRHKDFKLKTEESKFVDYQKIRIQEPVEFLKGSQQPTNIDIYVSDDIVNMVTPGDKIKVTGMLRLVPPKEKKLVYGRFVEAAHVEKTEKEFEEIEISKEEEEQIQKLSKDPQVYEKLVKSIAPNIYGHELVKEAIALQLFGGVKKRLPGENKIRGNIHVLLVGEPGMAKCVDGETKLLLADGTMKKINEIVEHELVKGTQKLDDGFYSNTLNYLPILNENCNLVQGTAVRAIKRKADKMFYLKTKTGKELKATHTHPLFVSRAGKVKAVKTQDLKKGDFIATPRKLFIQGTEQRLNTKIEKGKTNAKHIDLPQTLNQELARFVSYMLAEGYMHKSKKSQSARFTNSDKEVIEDYVFISKKLFNLNGGSRFKNNAHEILLSSRELCRFLQKNFPELFEKSRDRKISELIMRSGDGTVKNFLKAFIETEGSIRKTQRTIEVSSASKELIESLAALLARFEIIGTVKKIKNAATNAVHKTKREYYRLRIGGKFAEKYVKEIGFISARKKEKAQKQILNQKEFNTNIDIVPNLSEEFLAIRRKLGLMQFEMGVNRGAYQHYERGDRNPSREQLFLIANRLIETYFSKDIFDKELEEKILNLFKLSKTDIFWDKIDEIKKIPAADWVYDLEVDGTHNFISNMVFSHNSQILQAVDHISPKSIYVAGKTTSAAGLSATAVKDEFGEGGWTIKAGALVLASGGIALIDELDKMECLTEDSLVCRENGEPIPIGEIFREAKALGKMEITKKGTSIRNIEDFFVLSMDEKFRIVKKKLLAVHEYPYEGRILKVKLQSGESIKVTPNHPFFSSNENGVHTVKAGLLKKGDFVLVPSYIPLEDQKKPSPLLSRLYGYLAGDGNVTYNPPENYFLRFTNKNTDLLEDFSSCCQNVFEKPAVIFPSSIREDGVITERLDGKKFVYFIGHNAPGLMEKFSNKHSPSEVFWSLENANNYLSALFDSEGSVDGLHNQVVFSSTSKRLIIETKTLLLKSNILSQIRKTIYTTGNRRTSFKLSITDRDSLKRFAEKIGFRSKLKQSKLEKIVQGEKIERTIINVIPNISKLLKEIRLGLGLTQKQCGINAATYCNFEKGIANISRKKAKKVLGEFQKKLSMTSPANEVFEKIRLFELFADGDIAWRKIKSVKEVTNKPQKKISHEFVFRVNNLLHELNIQKIRQKKAEKNIREVKEKLKEKEALILESLKKKNWHWKEIREIVKMHGIKRPAIEMEAEASSATVSRWINEKVTPPETAQHKVEMAIKKQLEKQAQVINSIKELIENQQNQKTSIYDLTVEGSHNFIANNIIVHNSEDRSALHEAMEQESYHKDFEIDLLGRPKQKIGEFVEKLLEENKNKIVQGKDTLLLDVKEKGLKVLTTDFNKIYETKIAQVSKHIADKEFIEIFFQNGRKIKVTENHPVFVLRNGKIETIPACELKENDFIPAPLINPFKGKEQEIEVLEILQRKKIELPAHNSAEFFRFLGYHITDGGYELNRGQKNGINFSNTCKELVEDYLYLIKKLFNFQPYIQRKSNITNVRLISIPLLKYLKKIDEKLISKSETKRIPPNLMNARTVDLAELLKALFDGDGGFYYSKNIPRLKFVTPNYELATQAQDLLLRFGIVSTIFFDKNYQKSFFRVDITGKENIEKYSKFIGFTFPKKTEKLKNFLSQNTKSRGYIIPQVSSKIMKLTQELKIKQNSFQKRNLVINKGFSQKKLELHIRKLIEKINEFKIRLIEAEKADTLKEIIQIKKSLNVSNTMIAKELGVSGSLIHYYESKKVEQKFRQIRLGLIRAIENLLKKEPEIKELEKIICGQHHWIKIKSVKKEKNTSEEWVYDIGIEPEHCFISSNLILHNSISVSKAGITTRFKTETSILSAANPKYSRFDPYQNFMEQINLPPSLMSRFDLFFLIRDVLDRKKDEEISMHILRTHQVGEILLQQAKNKKLKKTKEVLEMEKAITPAISAQMLKKFVSYARQNIFPILLDESIDAISKFYIELRDQGRKQGTYAATHRQLEALVRLSEASARIRLSDKVEVEDTDRAIRLFRSALQELVVDQETGKIDFDIITTGRTQTELTQLKKVLSIVKDKAQELDQVPLQEVIDEAKTAGLDEEKTREMISKLEKAGDIYIPKYGFVKPTSSSQK